LGKKEEKKKIAKRMIEKGEEKLKSARILLDNNQIEDSISRSYYAAYLTTKALLLLLGSSPKTHGGMITMVGLKIIKEGLLPPKIGKHLGSLLEARQNSDYAVFTYYDIEDAESLFHKARDVMDAIKKIINEKFL